MQLRNHAGRHRFELTSTRQNAPALASQRRPTNPAAANDLVYACSNRWTVLIVNKRHLAGKPLFLNSLYFFW